MENHIKIFDTTLRDGEQSPGFSMNQHEKLRLAHQLERLNADVIEAGFPIASDGDFETVKTIAKEIKNSTVAGLSRTRKKDVDRALEAIQPANHSRLHIFIATSDIHMKHKLKKNRDEVLEDAVSAITYAGGQCDEIEFSAEDASRSDKDFLAQIFTAAIDAGATIINVPDTVGYAMPGEYGELFSYLRNNIPNINQAILSAHCHDDLGLAVANSIAAVRNGAQQIECTINGIGERAGNASLEEVVMAFATREEYFDQTTNIDNMQLYPASQLLEEISGQSVQINKAIVGENAFAHEAGIHQHGVLNNPLTYEIMTPKSVGKTGNNIVLGKHSGRFALGKKLETLGYNLIKDDLNQLYFSFTKMADEQKTVSEEELLNLLADTLPHYKKSKKAAAG